MSYLTLLALKLILFFSSITFATEQNTKDYTEINKKLLFPVGTAASYVALAGGVVVATISVSNKIAQWYYYRWCSTHVIPFIVAYVLQSSECHT
jgi:hypothetical protein